MRSKQRQSAELLWTGLIAAAMSLAWPAADAAEQVVTFRSWSPIVETTNQMIAATKAENPDIKIEAQIFNYPEYIVDLQTRAAGGSLPDLIGLEPGALTQQYRDFLVPAQNCAEKVWGSEWQDKFYPLAVDQLRLGNPEGDENFYGLPVLTQTINLWYTIPVFEDAGLTPPTTYDEMLEAAKTFAPQGIAPLLVGAADGWLRRDIYMQLIHNIAPGLIYQAEVGEAKFTNTPFVEAMTWWKRLFDDQIIQPGALGLSAYPGSMELIEAGRAAMFPMGAWWQQQATRPSPPPLSQGLSGFAPMPFPDVTGKGEPPEDLLGGIDVMIGITKDAQDVGAACTVLTDWVGGAGAQVLINTFNDLPAFKGLEPETFETENQREVWRLFTEEWLPTVKYARQLRDPAVKQALEDALAAVAAGEKTPEEGMEIVQTAWESTQN
jgi:raffinose/stachyose/melibiose transport system substrate-binding protein